MILREKRAAGDSFFEILQRRSTEGTIPERLRQTGQFQKRFKQPRPCLKGKDETGQAVRMLGPFFQNIG